MMAQGASRPLSESQKRAVLATNTRGRFGEEIHHSTIRGLNARGFADKGYLTAEGKALRKQLKAEARKGN